MASSRRGSRGERKRVGDLAGLPLTRVVDRALIDRNGRRAGRVDDLELDVTKDGAKRRIELRALVAGPLARPTWSFARHLARLAYRLVGVRDPRPAALPWDRVDAIDSMVHVDVDRDRARLRLVDAALERVAARIPGAARRP